MPIHLKINCGGPALTNDGWLADQYFYPASYSEAVNDPANHVITGYSQTAAPEAVYDTYRKCFSPLTLPFRYEIPVPNGAYIVRLHFADDTANGSAGAYTARIEINQVSFGGVDPNIPHAPLTPAIKVLDFNTEAKNGLIKIELTGLDIDKIVKISGIEIIEDSAASAAYTKIAELQKKGRAEVGQIVAVSWPAPTGIKYYSTTALDELHNFRSLPVGPVEPRLLGKQFLSFELSPDLSDEEITLEFADLDGDLQSKFHTHGEGVRVEIFYYYPETGLLRSRWFGQLRPPEENSYGTFSAKAASGFMSRLLTLPRRAFYSNCSAIFGGFLQNQAEINENDCPYSRHLGPAGFGNVDQTTGLPFTNCPKMTRADCTERLGNSQFFLGFDVSATSVLTDPRSGFWATSRGNANNLKRPLRVVIGAKNLRDFDLLTWRREINYRHPDKGFVAAVWAICEGPVHALQAFRVNDGSVNVQAINTREGQKNQPPTSYGGGLGNFSGTAHIFARLGWVNAAQVNAPDLKTFAVVFGLNNIRMYSTENIFTQGYTNNRVWGLLECYANRRWGRGYSYSRFHIPDWIEAAEWCDQPVKFTDPNGREHIHRRTMMDIALEGRVTHEQVLDICRSGRLSVPFQHEGKYTIVPLKKWHDLEGCAVFTDTGEDKNIIREGAKPAISYTIQSDTQIPNEVVVTFEDMYNADIERPLTFIDQEQQFKAGKAFGDSSFRPVQKRFNAFGVRTEAEAIKLGWSLLHLGEFDSGGLKNNLRVKFTTWHTQVLGLKRYDVIKVISPLIEIFGFEYFRIISMRQQSNLLVEITAQAYPQDYYEDFEIVQQPDPPLPPISGGGDIPPNTNWPPPRGPRGIGYDEITYENGQLIVSMS